MPLKKAHDIMRLVRGKIKKITAITALELAGFIIKKSPNY
jgi:hypothetical protein